MPELRIIWSTFLPTSRCTEFGALGREECILALSLFSLFLPFTQRKMDPSFSSWIIVSFVPILTSYFIALGQVYSKVSGEASLEKPTIDVSSKEFYGEGYDDSDKRIPDMTIINRQLGIYLIFSFLWGHLYIHITYIICVTVTWYTWTKPCS